MRLSLTGIKMARPSGLRSIMEDVAAISAGPDSTDWINLSVGNPAFIPEVAEMWRHHMEAALAEDFDIASCQYGPSRGNNRLVNALAAYFNDTFGWCIGPENIVVGPGSQMLCYIGAAIFAGPSESDSRRVLLPALPDYTGYQGLHMHDNGLHGVAPKILKQGRHHFRYEMDLKNFDLQDQIGMALVSSPSNPTCRSLSWEEQQEILRVATDHDFQVFIDHAYGAPFPRISSTACDPVFHPNVVNCFSMSKAGLPGERVGFAVGPAAQISAMVSFISNSTLHAPQLSQMVLARAIESGDLDRTANSTIAPYYARKRRVAERLLLDLLPNDVAWRLHSSDGGLFCWIWVDHSWFDDNRFYMQLKQKKVTIVPGRHFFVDGVGDASHRKRCFRISLAPAEAAIEEGVGRVSQALQQLACDDGE